MGAMLESFNSKKNLVSLGDFNIDILVNKPDSDEYKCLMSANGLTSLVNTPTRVFGDSKTCIDHVYYRCMGRNRNSPVLSASADDMSITDHHMISLEVLFRATDPLKDNTFGCNNTPDCYKKVDLERLNQSIITEDWSSVFIDYNPNSAYASFLSILTNLINQCTKLNQVNKISKLKPWMTDDLSSKIRQKNNLYKKLKSHPDNNRLITHYHNVCKRVKKLVIQTKEGYYRRKFQEKMGNIKAQWNIVNNILNINKAPNSIDSIFDHNNCEIYNKTSIANVLNNSFIDASKVFDSSKTRNIAKNEENNFFLGTLIQ